MDVSFFEEEGGEKVAVVWPHDGTLNFELPEHMVENSSLGTAVLKGKMSLV